MNISVYGGLMTDREILQAIENGIAFPTDRSIPPAVCGHVPMKGKVELESKPAAMLSYEKLDGLVAEGLANFTTPFNNCSNVVLTYKGKRALLEHQGFDFAKWTASHKSTVCCEKAIPVFCVCYLSYTCPDHGGRCHGTHD